MTETTLTAPKRLQSLSSKLLILFTLARGSIAAYLWQSCGGFAFTLLNFASECCSV